MGYTLLQSDLEIPPVDKLRNAFRSVSCLTDIDAHTLAKDAYGILVRNLSEKDAGDLKGALKREGIETVMVPDQDVPPMPPGKVVQRLCVTPDALQVFDPLGRPFPLEWGHIHMIAAGFVRMSNFKRIRTERVVIRDTGPYGSDVPETQVDYSTKEELKVHILLEIILTGAVLRYTADGEKFNYRDLGDRKQNDVKQNFATLVQDISQHAPNALSNRGTYYFRHNHLDQKPLLYPSKNAFYEEISWLLWRSR